MTGAAVAIESRRRVRSAGRDALVAVAALTLLAAALRFSTLGLQSYWYNEAATALLTKLSLGDMLDRIPRMEGNPPLYYVLAWAWAMAFGTGEVGLRSLSAVCGTAMVPAAYVAGARLANARAGVALACLPTITPVVSFTTVSSAVSSVAQRTVAATESPWPSTAKPCRRSVSSSSSESGGVAIEIATIRSRPGPS